MQKHSGAQMPLHVMSGPMAWLDCRFLIECDIKVKLSQMITWVCRHDLHDRVQCLHEDAVCMASIMFTAERDQHRLSVRCMRTDCSVKAKSPALWYATAA